MAEALAKKEIQAGKKALAMKMMSKIDDIQSGFVYIIVINLKKL